MDETDRQLLALLEENARMPTAALARRLHLSRSTIQDRIRRLEDRGIIGGYTLRLGEPHARRQITAHVMINVNPKHADRVGRALKAMAGLRSLHAISGAYDLIAIIRAETTDDIDAMLDTIGRLEGIDKTMSSIVLSTKFER
ncbi:Lrp/AsnC family transcriptional regulator [Govanella unica]|uniref:Lrp/AsnC family transcriptional regulator n=1 Tax=Govanella unica TaxID=2975056 RepID=A0A9X3TWW8_9PROT|nr:Lrp/AsnC family transcriptional regulator [Govania unica]MDA5193180.1 Lrp/AsnC family transcriptional regulator [Govania unica]